VAYVWYCKVKFDIINFKWYRDNTTLKELMAFSGWSVVGTAAGVLLRQGNSILVNRYFGVTLNAALGIANQVNTTISQFLYNFQTAFIPHIIKTYAKNEHDEVMEFTIRTSKFSFYLIYFIILPFMINIRFVLNVWLEEVPQYTEIFIFFLMGLIIIDAFSGPLWTLVEAEGNIKTYQLVGTVAGFASFIAIYIAYVLGAPYYIGQLIHNLQLAGFAIWRIVYLKKRVRFPMGKYIWDVFGRSGIIIVISIIVVSAVHQMIPGEVARFFGSCIASCIVLAVLYLTIGVNREERRMVVEVVRKKALKK
jgi:O-antigen/teichoic acid export membrane protein